MRRGIDKAVFIHLVFTNDVLVFYFYMGQRSADGESPPSMSTRIVAVSAIIHTNVHKIDVAIMV